MAGQHYCLRWNNYQSNMTSVFHQLLQTEAFVDVTLACNEASLKAHKVGRCTQRAERERKTEIDGATAESNVLGPRSKRNEKLQRLRQIDPGVSHAIKIRRSVHIKFQKRQNRVDLKY